jgi:hypothetical protein
VLLFLGAAWEVIVPGFGLSVLIAIAAGLGMLLCLDRRDLRGDLAACALLAVSLASFSVGVIFGAIGAAEVLQRDGRERLRRAWVFLAPALPYAIWLLWARKYNQPALDASNIGATPAAVADGAAATAAAIFGLSRTPGPEVPGFPDLGTRIEWGIPIATALVAALVLRVRRGPPPTPRAWALILGLLLYWVLLGLSVNEARFPSSSRYLYPAALLVLMLATELAAGLRITRRWRLAIAAVLAVSLFASVDTIRVGGYFFREEADYNRAELGALEISRARVAPEFEIELPGEGTLLPHGDIGQLAFQYFEASEEFGSPAYTEAELAAAGPPQRDAADQLLGRALRLRAEPLRRPPRLPSGTGGRIEPAGLVHHMTVGERRGCLVLRPDLGREGRAALQLPPGGFSYRAPPRAEVDIKLGRFGDGFAVKPGRVLGSAEVRIPTDGSDRPWRALIRPTEPLLACPA